MAGDRKQRRDAAANRERILAAASEAFRESGLAVDMRAVAEAAGVGIGTLYRHFPTREALVHAATGTDLTVFAQASLPPGRTAIDGLREFFTTTLTGLVANQAMIDLLAGGAPSDADLARCLAHLTDVGQEAVDRSRIDRTLARDVTASDIAYQFLGLLRIAQLMRNAEDSAIAHQVDLTLRALAAD